MVFLESVCPRCREKIAVDDEREKIFCMYCGSALSKDEFSEINGKLVLMKFEKPFAKAVDPRAVTVTAPETVAHVRLFADSKELVKLSRGETVVLDISPGVHTFWARSGIEGAKKTELDVHEGDRLRIIQLGMRGFEVIRD